MIISKPTERVSKINPGDKCKVTGKKTSLIKYFAYRKHGMAYFAKNKTEAVTAGRAHKNNINHNVSLQVWKEFKKC